MVSTMRNDIMKIFLVLFQLEIPSIDSLDLANEKRLVSLWSELKDLSTTKGVEFFGAGEKLQHLAGIDQLIKEFRKRKVESYSFADVKNLTIDNRRLCWTVGIRRGLLTIDLECELPFDRFDGVSHELIALNKILLSFVTKATAVSPFSFLRTPSVRFKMTRPPRFFGALAIDSIFDVVYLQAHPQPQESQISEQLKSGDLPNGVTRTVTEDFLAVKWGNITTERDAEAVLSNRYSWFVQNINFPIDSSFNYLGDKQFALWESNPTSQLTSYSSFDRRAAKAIVFDTLEEAEEQVRELQQILRSGKTIEGYPIEEITLIVPSRESAIQLHPLASRYGMRVVYTDDDRKLWNPFPPEYEDGLGTSSNRV